jgi:ankyrin repeat protein
VLWSTARRKECGVAHGAAHLAWLSLHRALQIVQGLDPAGLNLLIQSGAPVNYQDMWKRTPLHYAAREGQAEACQRLVELGADLTAQDFLGRTPLHLAARKGYYELQK